MLEFPVDKLGLHPTAKPVGLLEFLSETCPRPGEIVDASTGRLFVSIENETEFFRIESEVLGASRRDSA